MAMYLMETESSLFCIVHHTYIKSVQVKAHQPIIYDKKNLLLNVKISYYESTPLVFNRYVIISD